MCKALLRSLICVACAVLLATPHAAVAGSLGSPYLDDHADDPVRWQRWGEAVFAEARRLDRPVMLSIGYSACYWCGVMHRETFTDPDIAARINAGLVAVLVDRELHPDIDAIYQEAARALGVQRGWPLTLFLDADGTPFVGGGYFPDTPRGGVPSFSQLLDSAIDVWQSQREDAVVRGAARLAELAAAASTPLGAAQLARLQQALLDETDPFEGGFGTGVKHPRLASVEALWRRHLRGGEAGFGEAVLLAVERMSMGAIFDHVGGGLFRYATLPDWSQPHYEKMLDINAQFIHLLTEVWKETRSPLLAERVAATVAFLMAEMQLGDGGFASSLAADVAGRDGGFYRWSTAELKQVLGDQYDSFGALHVPGDIPVPRSREAGQTAWALHEALRNVRAERPRPERDDKVLAEWNAALVSALAEAGAAFARPDWLDTATSTYDLLLTRLWDGETLQRGWYRGHATGDGTLGDYAQLARAALALYDVTGVPERLIEAHALAGAAQRRFRQPDGAWQHGVSATPQGVALLRNARDGSLASGVAVIADVLARLYYLSGDAAAYRTAEQTLVAHAAGASTSPVEHGGLLVAADTLAGAVQVVIVGERHEPGSERLRATVLATALPGRSVQAVADGNLLPADHPAYGKRRIDEAPAAYVCLGTLCSLPATSADELQRTLTGMRKIDLQ